MKKVISIVFVCLSVAAFAQQVKIPYKGGILSMEKWMNTNLKYPLPAKELGIQGTVIVIFKVQETGVITDIRTKGELGWGVEEEAIRLVKQMPKLWSLKARNPNVQHALTIKFSYNELKCTVKIKQYQQRQISQTMNL